MPQKEIDLYRHFLIVSSSSFDILLGIFSFVLLSLFSVFLPALYIGTWLSHFHQWAPLPLASGTTAHDILLAGDARAGIWMKSGYWLLNSFLLDWSLMHPSTKSPSSTLDFVNKSLKLPLSIKEWYWPLL